MRGLIAAEKFYGAKKRKIVILISVIIVLLAGLMVFPGSLSAPKNARIKNEIRAFMAVYSALYQKRDVEGIMALYCNEPEIFMLSAGTGECFIGRAAIREAYQREFSSISEIKSVTCKIKSLLISKEFTSLASERYITTLRGNAIARRSDRFTAVLKKSDGRWVFMHTHFSLPSEQPNRS